MASARFLVVPRGYLAGVWASTSMLVLFLGPSTGWLAAVLLLGLVAVASVLALHSPQSPRGLSVLTAIPPAFVVLVFAAVITLQLGELLNTDSLGRVPALILWSVAMVAVVVVSFVRGGKVSLVGEDAGAAVAGAFVIALGVAVAVVQPFEVWSRAVGRSTDFNRHLLLVKQVVTDGGLNYADTSYPMGVHGLLAILWSAAGGASYESAWRGVEAILWIIVALLTLAIATIATRSLRMLDVRSAAFDALSVVLVLVVVLQSMWLTAFFRLGFVTSLAAGLILAALVVLAVSVPGWFGSAGSVIWLAIATAVMSQTWTLFVPTTGGLLVVAAAIALRTGGWGVLRDRQWLLAAGFTVFAALSTVPLIVSLVRTRAIDSDLSEGLAVAGGSGLENPQFWWLAAIGLSVMSMVLLWRARNRRVATFLGAIFLLGMLTVAFIAAQGAGPLGDLNYYAAKTMWSFTVVVIPLAVVGSIYLLGQALTWIGRAEPGVRRLLAAGGLAIVLTVILAGTAGRTAGTPSLFLLGVRDGFGLISAQIPTVTELERRSIDVRGTDERGVLLWGIFPNSSPSFAAGYSNALGDRLAMESTAWVGTDVLESSPALDAVFFRRTDDACRYLKEHPDALRITGPNPAAGAPWLIDSGCPAAVVKPEDWVNVPIDPVWFAGTEMAQTPYTYPTYDEFQAYLAEQEALRNQQAPTPSQN